MRITSEWSETEAAREVQVSWSCIYKWQKARQRIEYPNRQGQCSNASFALLSCHETRIVEKGKALNFRNSFRPHSHLWSWILIMTERVRSQVQAYEIRFLQKIEWVTVFNKMHSSEIRKSFNIESLLLRIEIYQLRSFGHVSRMPQERLPKQALLAKAILFPI